MRTNGILKKAGLAFLAVAMSLGVGTALSSTIPAQPAGIGQNRGDRRAVIRMAQRNGYNDGFAAGRRDRINGRRFDADRALRFQNAMAGYRPGFGNAGLYRSTYRAAFREGYDSGFRSGTRGGFRR